MRMWSATAVMLALACGCAGTSGEATPAPAPAPVHASGTATGEASLPLELPDFVLPDDDTPLTHESARALVEEIEAGWPPPAGDPLRAPASLDDAVAILKLDQTNLYGAAVEVAAKSRDLDGLALEAQIELAWGESYTVLMDILLRLVWQFDKRSMPLESKVELSEAELGQLDRLRQITRRTSRLVEAFQLVWVVHVSRGMHLARQVIEKYPDSYLGYRLAADYYRTTRDWEKFDAMIVKIAERNPDSNGLRFLRAAAAYQRDDDRQTAERLYREALAQDPAFVRAQAHLLVMQREVDDLHREYQVLADKNPNHPIVRWAGGLIEIAHRSFGAP